MAMAQIRVTEAGTEICSNFFGWPVMRKVGVSLSMRTLTTLQLCAERAQAARARHLSCDARVDMIAKCSHTRSLTRRGRSTRRSHCSAVRCEGCGLTRIVARSQAVSERARGARIRRALCDSVRDATIFAYRARVRVSVVRLVARSSERHCARSHLPSRARNHRAQVARATRAARHSRARCRHVASCAREACSTHAGVTDAPARRRSRAAIYICVTNPCKQ